MKTATPDAGTLTKEVILDWYMNDVLEGRKPDNVYLFSKNHKIEENDFYKFFNSFEGIENHFLEVLFDKTLETLYQSPEYEKYSPKEKILSFYFTFFGNLTQNRSFVIHLMRGFPGERIKKWKGLHTKFVAFVRSLHAADTHPKGKIASHVKDKALDGLAWSQFLSIVQFWKHDDSADFEKTDIFIEKSVTAGFELLNTKPLKSVVDLGKFLFKEIYPV